jgi:hypothetical protein
MSMVHVHVHAASPCSRHTSEVCVCECVFMCECVFVCEGVFVCVFVCINAGMPNCPASDQSGTGLKKLTMPGLVRYRTKPRQSGIFLVRYRTKPRQSGIFLVRYQTGIIDARMPMPALVSSMLMPSYACGTAIRWELTSF